MNMEKIMNSFTDLWRNFKMNDIIQRRKIDIGKCSENRNILLLLFE